MVGANGELCDGGDGADGQQPSLGASAILTIVADAR